MRAIFYNKFKLFFRNELLKKRQAQKLTQKQMAELLEMSERAYAELESGRSGCSVPTFLMFFVTCESPQALVGKLTVYFSSCLYQRLHKLPLESMLKASSYQSAMKVTQTIIFEDKYTFAICPRCGCVLDREYLRFCNNCGQKLQWFNKN